ncbi:MAG: 23S rRNA pseudouridine(1911/1915/1917) synthase RluD [Gammaproteobacteria bacterium]|nr:MAG: 23S rRNA pseudouridine(1911/1915/1917) synthase RluD [Gammaproteobacteria bacterium]
MRHEVRIPPALHGQRLDQALAALLPDYSRSRLKGWILGGRVRLEQAPNPAPRTRVAAGQRVVVDAEVEPLLADQPQPLPLAVVHEDPHCLIIDKPAGLVVHPGAGNRAGTLVNGLLHRWPELAGLPRAGLVHRLDKDTSGLMLVARSLAAHTRLVQALQAREIRREYRAVCQGRVTAGGRIDAPVGRHPVQRTRMAVVSDGRPAVTHYRVLRRFERASFLALRLETGRTHQIRVHLAHIGHPLIGDPVYAGRPWLPAGASDALRSAVTGFRRQALHAARLGFQHPASGEPLEFAAPLPADFRALLAALAGPGSAPGRFDDLQWPDQDSN